MTRVPPSSEEAERAVLCCVMIDPRRVVDLCHERGLNAESFYVQWHRVLFAELMDMHVKRGTVDVMMIAQYLRDSGKIEQVGGNAYLDKICEDSSTPAHAEYYIDIVIEKEMRRRVIDAARATVEGCYDESQDVESVRAKAEYDIAMIQRRKDKPDKPADILKRQIALWEIAQTKGCVGIQTGFRLIDNYFGGLMDSAFYIFSGPPGAGKTTLARNIAENLAMRGIPVGIFTLEQTSEQIWGAIAGRHAKQSVFLLNCGSVKASLDAVRMSEPEVTKWPIHVDDRPQTLTTLFSATRRLITKHGVKLVILDYIQSLREERKYENDTSRVSHYSIRIRDMLKELRIPMIAIASESDEGKLRNTRQLNYDCWAHLRIERHETWTKDNLIHKVSFEKQRFGPLCKEERLKLLGDEQRFEEFDP